MNKGIFLAILAVIAFRLAGPLSGADAWASIANFSPLAAIVVASALYLPRRAAFAVPFGALFVSHVVVNVLLHRSLLDLWSMTALATFALIFVGAWFFRGTTSLKTVFALAAAETVFFYLVTNTASFFFDPGYAKSAAGWLQCMTVGLPVYEPTWLFLVKSLAGNLLFTGLFVLACHPFVKRSSAPAALPATL